MPLIPVRYSADSPGGPAGLALRRLDRLGTDERRSPSRNGSGTGSRVSCVSTDWMTPVTVVLSGSWSEHFLPRLAWRTSMACRHGSCWSSVWVTSSQPATMPIKRPSRGVAQNEPSTAASGTSVVEISPRWSVTAEPRLTIRQ